MVLMIFKLIHLCSFEGGRGCCGRGNRCNTALSQFVRKIYEIHFRTAVDLVVNPLVKIKLNRQ